MSLLNTLINGHCFDFSSIKLTSLVPTTPLLERFTAISYETSNEPGELRGRGSKVLGTTRGELSSNASMTIYTEDFELLKAGLMTLPTPLGGGFMEKRFLLTVAYAELGAPVITDTLRGVRIIRVGKNYQRGNEPLMVDLGLHVMEILYGGVPAVIDGSGVLSP